MALPDAVRPRVGRPRDPSRDEAILDAAIDELVDRGYAGLSIEGVAARAGVGKATIYRRYTNKAELVVDAVRQRACIDDVLPDTGDVRADLTSMMDSIIQRLRGPDGAVLLAFHGERLRHPDLAVAFDQSVIGQKRRHIRDLLRSAVDRGDIPADIDLELVAEAGAAFIWHHALYDLPLTDDLPGRILDLVLPTTRSPAPKSTTNHPPKRVRRATPGAAASGHRRWSSRRSR